MITPNFNKFKELCRAGNLVPVYREHLADMETPVSVFSRFVDDERSFLLESVEGGERWGRYSFIGVYPHSVFSVEDGVGYLLCDGVRGVVDSAEQGIKALREIINGYRLVNLPELPRFFAGAVGYMNYETVAEFEDIPIKGGNKGSVTACFMLSDTMIIFDNIRHTMKVVASVRVDNFASYELAYADAEDRIAQVEARLAKPVSVANVEKGKVEVEMQSNMSKDRYLSMVNRVKEYIVEGDIIQAVLSQRFTTDLPAEPLAIYRALRLINPSPYTFFLKLDKRILVGSSPEVMVRLTGNKAEVRPIAGTRVRGKSEQEDRELADGLLSDKKERAEHLMLVDLARNDLGRVAISGSVQVRDFMTVERYSHVMHIVSNVQATLAENRDAFDLIHATFPAGTLSGAPKIRAMEIIGELEPDLRNVYGGAVGYIGYDGNMDLAITIRTLVIEGEKVSIQAGAGIVYDSEPESEFAETEHKARGMVKALELAANGLDL